MPEVWQPKKTIADYVESEGIPVPRRFNDIEEAAKFYASGGKFILRSEHPEEYDGPSGLADSYLIDQRTVKVGEHTLRSIKVPFSFDAAIRNLDYGLYGAPEQSIASGHLGRINLIEAITSQLTIDPEITEQRLLMLQKKNPKLWLYAQYTGQTFGSLLARASFSYWEHIDGHNVTVVADDAIDGRYHTLVRTRRGKSYGDILDESGNPIAEREQPVDIVRNERIDAAAVISLYESIRALGRFCATHCPTMEFQVNDDGIYFLQYHRTRDFNAPGFTVNPSDFSETDAWLQADAVRGATDGILASLMTALKYTDRYGRDGRKLPEHEDASMDYGHNSALNEVLSRRRTAYISTGRHEYLYSGYAMSHEPRSRWFKPAVSLSLGDVDLLSPELNKQIRAIVKEGRMARAVIDVVSDGKIGFARLHPDSEQPIVTDN